MARRDFWIMVAVLTFFVALVIFANMFLPQPAGGDFFRRPVFVVLFWMLMMLVLFRRWQKERSSSGGYS